MTRGAERLARGRKDRFEYQSGHWRAVLGAPGRRTLKRITRRLVRRLLGRPADDE